MIKGLAQSERNNAWHQRHIKKLAKLNASHESRVLNRSNGVGQMSHAERNYRKSLEREATKKVGFFSSLKYKWLMAKIKTQHQMKRLFNNPQHA